jgi:hypothetical protein
MRAELLGSTKLFVDETTAPVLDPGRGRTKKGYFWALARDDRSWRAAHRGRWCTAYSPGRGGDYAAALLKGYSGVLQTDGYAGYREDCQEFRAEVGHDRRKGAQRMWGSISSVLCLACGGGKQAPLFASLVPYERTRYRL